MSAQQVMSEAVVAAALEQLRRTIDGQNCAEYWALRARQKRIAYEAFVAAGFTQAEALQLTIAVPM